MPRTLSFLSVFALASTGCAWSQDRSIADFSWWDLAVLAAADGAEEYALEREIELASGGDEFEKRAARRSFIQGLRDEAASRSAADQNWRADLNAASLSVSVDVAVPEYDFGNQMFRFCVPSSVNFFPEAGLVGTSLELKDIQLAIDFFGHDSGLWALLPWNGGCATSLPFRDKYADPASSAYSIGVNNTLSVVIKDEAEAERIHKAMAASPDGLIETRVNCSSLENPYAGQVFPRCWVTSIEVGRNPDGTAWFTYTYKGQDGWAVSVGNDFLFPSDAQPAETAVVTPTDAPLPAGLAVLNGTYAADPRLCPPIDDGIFAEIGEAAWELSLSTEGGKTLAFPENPCEIATARELSSNSFALEMMCFPDGLAQERDLTLYYVAADSFVLAGQVFSKCGDKDPTATGNQPEASGVEAVSGESPETATAEMLLAEVLALNDGLSTATPEARREEQERMRALLDQIVTNHPESDIALKIVLEMVIDGLDVAALNRELAEAPVPAGSTAAAGTAEVTEAPDASAVLPAPETTPSVGPADEATEAVLALDESGWRDVQARLLVLGHDPNGIDGQAGIGTRRAISAWQSEAGIPVNGYLAADHMALLVSASQDALDLWLQDSTNKELYTPPPPIDLTARNVNGNWSFTATCGKNSAFPGQTITGVMKLELGGGGKVSGTVRNSQGFNGRVNGRLDGRRMSGEINWGLLLGRVDFWGRIASQSLSFRGEDANGCSLKAYKG